MMMIMGSTNLGVLNPVFGLNWHLCASYLHNFLLHPVHRVLRKLGP